jgi:AmmeMemoRadiSam system protein B
MSATPDLRARPPAVAGKFYPADPEALLASLRASFDAAVAPDGERPTPQALIVPHAGYPYSGPVAASAYLRLVPARETIRRVVLIGPSHRVPVGGVAVPSAGAFDTPLGRIPIDRAACEVALGMPGVVLDDRAHQLEHSLEVQLPFLQVVLDDVELVPLVAGRAPASEVSAVLEALWGGPETVVVASSDLSHYHPYDEAAALDRHTAAAILAREPEAIGDSDACGAAGLRGLLVAARDRRLCVEQVDLRSSGDTAGDRRQVVGYGAFAIV